MSTKVSAFAIAAGRTGSGTKSQPPGAEHGLLEETLRGGGRVTGDDLFAHPVEQRLDAGHLDQVKRGGFVRDDAAHQVRPASGQRERDQGAI